MFDKINESIYKMNKQVRSEVYGNMERISQSMSIFQTLSLILMSDNHK